MIGEKLGPYEIFESISSGGMGSVYKAKDTRLGRIVAIKKVKEHSERFKQEARSIAALNHPNICQIHDIGEGQGFLVGRKISHRSFLMDHYKGGFIHEKQIHST